MTLITQALLRDGLGRLAAAGGTMNVAYRERVSHHVVGPQPGGTSLGLHAVMKSLERQGLAVSLGYLEGSDCLEGFQITDAGVAVLENPDHVIPPPAGAIEAGVGPPSLMSGYEQAMRDAGAVETIGKR
jgi:hypothetical protein